MILQCVNLKTLGYPLLGDTLGNSLQGSDRINSGPRIFGTVAVVSLA